MGKQRVDTGSRLRRIKDELGLATFLLHGVVACNRDLAEGLAVRNLAVTEQNVIHAVGKPRHAQRRREPDDDQSLQEMLDSRSQR